MEESHQKLVQSIEELLLHVKHLESHHVPFERHT
jgi:hypothetical protein